jgi:hypothetical protein
MKNYANMVHRLPRRSTNPSLPERFVEDAFEQCFPQEIACEKLTPVKYSSAKTFMQETCIDATLRITNIRQRAG